MPSNGSDHDALVDDAVHEINQRWGEPWGDDTLPMDQKLVRETAEAIVGHVLRAVLDVVREAHPESGGWEADKVIEQALAAALPGVCNCGRRVGLDHRPWCAAALPGERA